MPPSLTFLRKAAVALGCLALMGLISWMGRMLLDRDLGGLYLLPFILLGTWYGGKPWGYVLAVASALLTLTALEPGADELARVRSLWEAVMHLGVYCAFTMLLGNLRNALARERALARTDSLTGAWNVRAFRELAGQEIARARRSGRPLTLACLDMDRFKDVNDLRGHEAGDEVLKSVVVLLKAQLRVTDLVARLGGDEFAILLPESGREAALLPLERIRNTLQADMQAKGLPVSVSIGTVTFPAPPPSVDEMLRQADARLYEAKRSGKNRIVQADAG